jgi:uncharacterized protein (TIGR02301 family)
MNRCRAAKLVAAAILLSGPLSLGLNVVHAQQNRGLQTPRLGQKPPAAPPQPEPPPPPPEPPPAPYERDLLRLAEVIGSLAFLRQLCTASDAAEWPRRMQALVETEGTTPGRKERLAGAYNRGYQGWALTYRVCTPAAREATGRYIKEGEAISRTLAGRFGG